MIAKHHTNRIIAANAASRNVKMVTRHGYESLKDLDDDEMKKLPPLPIPVPSDSYHRILKEGMGFSDNKIAAQNLWDAAMANNCLTFSNQAIL